MTDELTPEEKEALRNLPRERMPIGLEARVVEAMREHGFLAKRRRWTIEITSSRVAGLVAACVALMIGAYAIGLQRSGVGSMRALMAPVEEAELGRAHEPVVGTAEKKTDVGGVDEGVETVQVTPERNREAEKTTYDVAREAEQPVPTRDDRSASRKSRPEPASAPAEKPTSVVTARPDEATNEGDRPQVLEKSEEKVIATPQREIPMARGAALEKAGGRAQPLSADEDRVVSNRWVRYLLNGSPILIDAPDSVRVTQDDQGRILIIYTSDGILRIRLADDN